MTTEQVRIAAGRSMLIAGFDKYFGFTQKGEIPALWQQLVPYMATTPHRVEQVDYGVVHSMDDGGFGYLAGFEVSNADGAPEGFSTREIPAQRYAVFQHEGDLSTLSETINFAWKEWLPTSGEQAAAPPLMIERYGPAFNSYLRRGDLEIWLALQG